MWGLILFIYLIDVLDTLDSLLVFGTVLLGTVTFAVIGFWALTSNEYECDRHVHKTTSYILKAKWFYTLWFICLLNLFIPQKQTMHLMAGLYLGNEVITEVSKSPLAQKAYKLTEQKLDEYLTEPNKETK